MLNKSFQRQNNFNLNNYFECVNRKYLLYKEGILILDHWYKYILIFAVGFMTLLTSTSTFAWRLTLYLAKWDAPGFCNASPETLLCTPINYRVSQEQVCSLTLSCQRTIFPKISLELFYFSTGMTLVSSYSPKSEIY